MQTLSSENQYFIFFNYVILFIVATCTTYFSQQIPFFWDNVSLVSRLAVYYYETSFQTLILPNEIDPGHPPFYPLYVAGMWTIFGKTIAVSHWLAYPFLLGIYWLYYRLCCLILPNRLHIFALLLLLLEPTLLAQSCMAGIDIALVFATLLALNGIFYQQTLPTLIGFLLMASISLRSIIGIALFGICEVVWLFYILQTSNRQKDFLKNYVCILFKKIIPTYIPALLFIAIWYYYHYQEAGFLMVNSTAEAWNQYYGYSSFSSFIWNLCIIIWRFFDHGRYMIWLVAAYFLWQIVKQKNIHFSKTHIRLLLFAFLPIVLYSFIIAARNNPIMHRYLIVYYLLFGLLLIALFPFFLSKTKQKIAITLISLSLISGHFWVYPYPIANGWDANLSYLPYFKMQKNMLKYIHAKNIDYQNVAAEFPCAVRGRFSHLNQDDRQFDSKQNRPFSECKYILHSNLMNDFSLQELKQLEEEKYWQIEKKWEAGQLYMILYKNKRSH
ncbi:MAG: hypothetical protein ACPG5B_00895 [Chitinophagales bacterium]